ASLTVASTGMSQAKFTSLPSGFNVLSYTCGNADALPGAQFGTYIGQQVGPGLLNSVDAGDTGLAGYITARGQEVDVTPAPGPNHTPALINVLGSSIGPSGPAPPPGYHIGACSGPGSLIGGHGPSHSVAVDHNTNQVFVAVPSNALGTAGTNNQIIGSFTGWQPAGSSGSLFPIDPQYPPSPIGVGS